MRTPICLTGISNCLSKMIPGYRLASFCVAVGSDGFGDWQEVLLARCAEILCGHEWLSWECFRKAILLFRRKPVDRSILQGLLRTHEIIYSNKQDKLVRVMERTKDAQCSDPRDRIYGILHLLEESERLETKSDYTKTTVEVYRDLMIRSFSQTDELSLLSCCELSDELNQLPSWVPKWSHRRKCCAIPRASACWASKSYARYDDCGLLTVLGCFAATVRKVVPVLDYTSDSEERATDREVFTALIRLLLTIGDDGSMDLGQEAEAVCRTLVCDRFADRYEPISTNIFDFQKTIKCFHALIENPRKASKELLIDFRNFFEGIRYTCVGRAFIFTEQGHIGLAPERCQPDDIVAIVSGCRSPMVLQPTDTSEYLVVGECYIHGMMSGELFLGPLPKNWQRVNRYAEEEGHDYNAFIDRTKGVWQARDPRLGPLPEGWIEVEHPDQHIYALFRDVVEKYTTDFDSRMLPLSLCERGFSL